MGERNRMKNIKEKLTGAALLSVALGVRGGDSVGRAGSLVLNAGAPEGELDDDGDLMAMETNDVDNETNGDD
jgi:hypothetical protein